MATVRPFAYNTGTTLSGTVQYGTLSVGVDPNNPYNGNYGGIRWWNGPDEDLGYCIGTSVPSGDQPTPFGNIGTVTFWRTQSFNDNEFISLSKKITGQNFTSANETKLWLNDNGYWTSYDSSVVTPTPTPSSTPTNTVTPTPTITPSSNIVTSNLILDYNFEDENCYPGVGTTVFDLSTPQYNGTLFNSPTHSYGDGGYFDFDGINQYIEIAHNSELKPTSAITMEQWLWADDWNAGVWPTTYLTPLSNTQGGGYANYLGSGIFVSYVRSGGVYQTVSGTTTSLSGWHNFTTTFDGRFTKLYIDGILEDTVDIGTSGNPIEYAFDNSLLIGAEASSTTTPQGFYWDGKISITRIYNSALSDSQVLQNHNFSSPQFVSVTPTPTVTSTPTPEPTTTPTITPTSSEVPLTPTPTPSSTPTSGPTPSGFTVNIYESGSDVVMSVSGNLNINDLSQIASGSSLGNEGLIVPVVPTFIMSPATPPFGQFDLYSGFTSGPSNLGAGGFSPASSFIGDVFGIVSDSGNFQLFTPVGYESSDPISSTQTFAGQSFTSLGLVEGTYTYTWGSGANAEVVNVVVGGTPPPPSSGFTVTISEVGSDVVWSASGSLDLSNLSFEATQDIGAGFNATTAIWAVGPTVQTSCDAYGGAAFSTFPTTFGTAGAPANSGTGDILSILDNGIGGRRLLVPVNYVSGSPLSGTTTYQNTTISGLNLISGTYTYSWGDGNGETLTLIID